MRRLKTLPVVLLFTLSILLSSCNSTAAPRAESEALIPVKLVSLPFISFAPIHIAMEEGYFEDQGLAVEIVTFERGIDAYTALINNDVDVWGGGITASLFNAIARSDIRIVADRGYFPANDCGYSMFLLSKELYESGTINSAADLAGLRIVQDNEGGFRDYGLRMLLASGGLTLEDAEILTVPDPALVDGFMEGSIDLAAVTEPRISTILATGSTIKWKTFAEVVPDFQYGLLVFGDRLLHEQPEVGEKFIAAYRAGLAQYSEGKTERNLEIMTTVTGMEREALEDTCWPIFHTDGQINMESVLSFQDWAVSEGYLEAPLAPEDFWDPQFVD